jgi:anti-sigma regulatory factor (Ser/Thr protein kinase)/serine/threonine protein phosphatase PrpC
VGPVLGAGVPPGVELVLIDDEASISLVREAVRRLGGEVGMAIDRYEALVAAASELGHNQLAHGHRGSMAVSSISRDGVAGLEVVAFDEGHGINDPTAALRGEPRASGSLGVGLSAAYRLCDEMDFDVRLGEGTYVAARKFATPLPRSEVAIFGRPIEGERESGDDAAFVRSPEALLVAVADGLGHGPEAREASARAMVAVRGHAEGELASLLGACDRALRGTRGAVMAVARFDRGAHILSHASAGNINSHLYRPRATRRFGSVSCVLGARGPSPRLMVETEALEPRPLLVMFSDGISSRADLSGELELLRQPPLVIAHQMVMRHGRSTDDALVLVAS